MCLLVATGAVVFWPALTTPFFLDDYLHSAMVAGRFPVNRGPFDLYDFVGDDDRQALFDRGFLPWWTDPRLTLRFFRPLSSALLFYEHRWIGEWPQVMHLHSFAWWVLAVLAARALFRRTVPPRAAAFATVIFALAPCHALPLGWLANREALIAVAFGTAGITALLRWQSGGGARWAAVSLASFSLALLAGEYALGCAGFVLAFVVCAPADQRRRWWSLLLFGAPATAYLVARHVLGYGAAASGFYQDPLQDPWLFIAHIPWRLVSVMMFGWFTQDPTVWVWGDSTWVSFVVCGLLSLATWRTLSHVTTQLSPELRRTTWTFVLGAILSLFPVLAVLPSPRLLGVAMLGIAPAIGVILDTAWFGREEEARHGLDEWTAITAMLLGFLHLIHGPARGWYNAKKIRTHAAEFAAETATLAKRLEGREAPEVIVVRGVDDVFFFGFALERAGIRDTRWIVLSHTGHVLCRRLDPTTIELLVSADSSLYPAALGDLYRSELNPLQVSDVYLAGAIRTTVLEMAPFGPRRASFQFAADLDDPRWTWVGESRWHGFYDATPPKVGFGQPFDP